MKFRELTDMEERGIRAGDKLYVALLRPEAPLSDHERYHVQITVITQTFEYTDVHGRRRCQVVGKYDEGVTDIFDTCTLRKQELPGKRFQTINQSLPNERDGFPRVYFGPMQDEPPLLYPTVIGVVVHYRNGQSEVYDTETFKFWS